MVGANVDWSGCGEVEQVAGKLSGVPMLKHSPVQADAVWENYLDGFTVEEVADMFRLPLEQVRAVVEYAKER